MEKEVALTVNGQEVQQSDLNTIGQEAARSTDWLLGQLLRPSSPAVANTPYKYIVPAGGRKEVAYAGPAYRSLIVPSPSNDAKVRIYPFMALIGALETAVADVKNALRNVRTVGHYGANNNNECTSLQLAAAVSLGRFDLIYAKIDIDVLDTAVSRYVKSGAGAAAATNIQVTKQTVLTLGIVQGTEAATPVRPAPPADSTTTFYIPLAYVRLGSAFTLTSAVTTSQIHEVYDTIPMSSAVGVPRLRPANGMHRVNGYSDTENWNSGRPKSYLPAGMVGGDQLLVALHAMDSGHGTPSVAANSTTVIDTSVDWRRRLFKTVSSVGVNNDGFPWGVTPPPGNVSVWQDFGTTPQQSMRVGNSFISNNQLLDAGSPANGAVVAWWTQLTTPALATGAVMILFVDLTSGNLKVWRNNVDAGRMVLCWLEASAPFGNYGDFTGAAID